MKNQFTYRVYIICILLCLAVKVKAQETNTSFSENNQEVQDKTQSEPARDSILPIQLSEDDLQGIGDIRAQFEKQNKTYSAPAQLNENLLRFIQKDKLELSDEAKYWINYMRDVSTIIPEWMTFRDTVIPNPLYIPLVFRSVSTPQPLEPTKIEFKKQKSPFEDVLPEASVLPEYALRKSFQDSMLVYIERKHPEYFKYSQQDMPNEILVPVAIVKDIKEIYEAPPLIVKADTDVNEVTGPPRFIPDRLYWTSAFYSSIHFSQLYISPNWHQGGVGNLNIVTLNKIDYNYKKDKVSLTNLLELKLSINNAPKDTLRRYTLGDNSLRLRSNFGYRAFNKWDYSATAELNSLLFDNYKENTRTLSASFLAPVSFSLSIGMKYNLNKTFKSDKHKRLNLSLNLDPLSYTLWYSAKINKIDLGRYGFPKIPDPENPDKKIFDNSYKIMGSTINSTLDFKINRNVSYYSRFRYNTNYERVIVESENRLDIAVSRYLSTNINFYLRFDDGVTKKEDFDSYFQIREQMTFGLTYKW